MSSNSDSLRDTIAPKSDQLNADDLIAGPITVRIVDVRRSSSTEQPVDILIEGHQPFRPCKSMRRVLISAWGDKGKDWVGQSMTLYCDPTVKFGGVAVGGIRISHLSGIDRPMQLMLTTTRSKRAAYVVEPIPAPADYPDAEFQRNLPAWVDAMTAGKLTFDKLRNKTAAKGNFTDAQLTQLEDQLHLKSATEALR